MSKRNERENGREIEGERLRENEKEREGERLRENEKERERKEHLRSFDD